MISKTWFLIVLFLGLTFLLNSSVSSAADWNKSYTVVFKDPVAVPGKVLPAGIYVFKLMDDDTNCHIVQIWNAERTQIVAALLSTIMMVVDNAPAENLILFEDQGKGQPPVIKAWFHPGDPDGEEFVYTQRK